MVRPSLALRTINTVTVQSEGFTGNMRLGRFIRSHSAYQSFVAAMTQDELPEVKKENVPSAQPVAGSINFLQILNAHGISDVRDRYGDRRENWRPFGSAFRQSRKL